MKIELYEQKKQTANGETVNYFIRKDGILINESVTLNEEQAKRFFDLTVAGEVDKKNTCKVIKEVEI
jgi:hypothetical protein